MAKEPETDGEKVYRLRDELTRELHARIRTKLQNESEAVIEGVLVGLHEQFRFWRNFNPGSEGW